VSVGDSPLFLIREGALRRLNKVHSLATHLDFLAEVGEITAEGAAAHPGRHVLTSALGTGEIEQIDCPDAPVALAPGDVVLAASDGLLTLAEGEIARLVAAAPDASAGELAEALLEAVAEARAEGQDNVSVAVLRAAALPVAAPRPGLLGRLFGAPLRTLFASRGEKAGGDREGVPGI